jgi:hypothetical protein
VENVAEAPAPRRPAARLPELAAREPAQFGLNSAVAAPQLPRPVPPQPPVVTEAQPAQPPVTQAAPRQVRPSVNASGGGPLSASESDPFRVDNPQVRFVRGQMEVRFGREVRTSRPRLTPAAQLDVVRLRFPVVVMRVETDRDGNVISADIHRSSGSGQVDLACRIAMLDWWIEPPKDANDDPIPDVMYWRLSWQ